MNVLTLSSSEDVKAVTVKKLQTEKYDKIVINGVKDLDSFFYSDFSEYVTEIEAVDCTLIDNHFAYHINGCKCTFKNTKADSDVFFTSDSSTVVIDNWPVFNRGIVIEATKGITNFSLLNSKSTYVYFQAVYSQFGSIAFSNCQKLHADCLPLGSIPTTDTSAFMAQFESLSTIAEINSIDVNNYEISQADWDKAIDLLNQYPTLLEDFHLNCDMVNKHSSNVYYHIPSLTFPLPWINSLLALGHISKFDMTTSSVLLNKNDKPNFTVTHVSKNHSNFDRPQNVPFFIADNYKDAVNFFIMGSQHYGALTYGRYYHNQSMLSGKLATSEITLIANSLFAILTMDQNMQKHVTKIRTGIHGKTMKITSMEPFGALKVFATKANDLTGEFIVPSVVSEDLIGVVAVNQIQKDISGSIGVPLITAHDFDGTINIATLTQETNIYGIITTMPVIRVNIDGSMDIQSMVTQELNGTANIVIPAPDVSIEGSIVILGIQKYITGKISIPSVNITEIDGMAVIKHQVEKEFDGEITVNICRAEILGSLEIQIGEKVNE